LRVYSDQLELLDIQKTLPLNGVLTSRVDTVHESLFLLAPLHWRKSFPQVEHTVSCGLVLRQSGSVVLDDLSRDTILEKAADVEMCI
jgi:hypothetical protein